MRWRRMNCAGALFRRHIVSVHAQNLTIQKRVSERRTVQLRAGKACDGFSVSQAAMLVARFFHLFNEIGRDNVHSFTVL